MQTQPSTRPEVLAGGQLLVAVSDAIAMLVRESSGKGPERCKSFWAGPDMLVVQLLGGFTVAERTLFEAGQGQVVQAARRALHETLEAQFRGIVEDLTGREVRAVMSSSNQDPDLSIDLFVLAPQAFSLSAAPAG